MTERDASCPPTPCVEGEGYRGADGYGRVNRRGSGRSPQTAHRWTWEQAHGPLPDNLYVMHLCHNRPCVNVEHLRPGTNSENLLMSSENLKRDVKGTKNPAHRLTEDDVRAIRASTDTQVSLGERYGVRQTTISMVVTGRTWRHVQ